MSYWIVGIALCMADQAPVEIKVEREVDRVRVEIRLPAPAKEFRIPAWAPGDYQLHNLGKNLRDLEFRRKGKVVAFRSLDVNTWEAEEAVDQVRYFVVPSIGNFSPFVQLRENETFLSGPGVFGYFAEFRNRGYRLSLPPEAFTTLPLKENTVRAKDYDELIDTPIVFGSKIRIEQVVFDGKPHRIVAFGRAEGVELRPFLTLATLAAEQAKRTFGTLPYPSYTYFLDFGGRGGGLEHRHGTRIGASPRTTPNQLAGIMFHEYIHAWIVKEIRPKNLGPFDYSKPAVTGSLWFLEGVTDYLAEIWQLRCNLTTREELLRSISFTERAINAAPYQRLSVHEASERVWSATGSYGFGNVNYYTKGRQIGALLDIHLRKQTNHTQNLDSLLKKLYTETGKGKPGYEEGRIRELFLELAGEESATIYDQAVMKPGPLPWAEVLQNTSLSWRNGLLVDVPARGRRINMASWPYLERRR